MLKRLIIVPLVLLVSAFTLAACETEDAFTAVEMAALIGKQIHAAKSEHPDDFKKRAEIYAGFYCEVREKKGFEWEKIRGYLSEKVPQDKIAQVKSLIDNACPLVQDG